MCEPCRHDGAAGKARAPDNEDLNYRKGRIRSAGPFLMIVLASKKIAAQSVKLVLIIWK